MRKPRIVGLSALALAGLAVAIAVSAGRDDKGRLFPRVAKHAAVESKLDTVLPAVRFEQVTLREAVASLGRASGADLVLDGDPADLIYVDLHVRNVTLGQALDIVTGYVNSGGAQFSYTLHRGSIVLTEDPGRYAYARIYDVRDVEVLRDDTEDVYSCFGGPVRDRDGPPWLARQEADDEIIWIVQETVRPDLWSENGGTAGSVHAMGGRLFVTAPWEQHRAIDTLLARLRVPGRLKE